MKHKNFDSVLILDFGSQYTKLIARRIREMRVYSEIAPFSVSMERIREAAPKAIILSGGPSSVYEADAPRAPREILDLGVPILGVCYGLQLIAHYSGMDVEPAGEREYGLAKLEITGESRLLAGVPNLSNVWMSHGDRIGRFPDDYAVTGRTANTGVCVIESEKRRIYGVQFHPEVVHTAEGAKILANFLFDIAGLQPRWNMGDFIQEAIADIRDTVGKEKIILGLSGGVDSTVLALLLQKAVGDQLVPVFIDNGLLRKNEYNDLMRRFRDHHRLNVTGIDASNRFLDLLAGVSDPEKKRKIIGKTFIDIFSSVQETTGPVQFLAQGTLYPDVIESVSVNGPSVTIKSHHNVGGLPEKMHWKLIEPFRELFKDEVREIGKTLGLEDEFIWRHPFPGPGLAVRVLGEVTRQRLDILREADAILTEEMFHFDIYYQIWQAFAVLLPVQTVGVMGDLRTYENACALRLVTSVDGMTADWFPAPPEFLQKVANRIVNEVKGINRVVYDLTSKPPGTIEWE